MSSESRPNDRPTKTRRSPPIKQTLQLPHALKQREVRAFLTHFFSSFHFTSREVLLGDLHEKIIVGGSEMGRIFR